jgi:hypothetical protein
MLFIGRCGHIWIGSSWGVWCCPHCGDYDGNDHLLFQGMVEDCDSLSPFFKQASEALEFDEESGVQR